MSKPVAEFRAEIMEAESRLVTHPLERFSDVAIKDVGHSTKIENLEISARHNAAISLLRRAERYRTREYAEILLEIFSLLKPELLPENFAWRLCALLSSIPEKSVSPTTERDQWIRNWFFAMTSQNEQIKMPQVRRQGKPYQKMEAYKKLAERHGISERTVRNIISEPVLFEPGPTDDYSRLQLWCQNWQN